MSVFDLTNGTLTSLTSCPARFIAAVAAAARASNFAEMGTTGLEGVGAETGVGLEADELLEDFVAMRRDIADLLAEAAEEGWGVLLREPEADPEGVAVGEQVCVVACRCVGQNRCLQL